MTSPIPGSTSGTARLMTDPPAFAVGWQEPVYVPAPAAGASWSHVVDGRFHQRFVSLVFTFTTSAVVANRLITLQLADTNNVVIAEAACGGQVAASSTLTVTLTPNSPGFDAATSGHSFGYVPGILAPPGWRWQAVVAAQDVADQFSGIVLLVQRFPNDSVAISA